MTLEAANTTPVDGDGDGDGSQAVETEATPASTETDDLTSELNDMLGASGSEVKVEPEPEPKPDAEAEAKSKPTEAETKLDAKPKPESEPEPKPSELDELKAQNQKLMDTINSLMSGKGLAPEATETSESEPKPETKPEVKPEPEPETEPEETDLFDGVPFIEIMESEETFKSFLGKFSERIQNQTAEAVLRAVPQIVTSHTANTLKMQKQVDSFYSEHEALTTVKPLVGATVNQVLSENPGMEMGAALTEAGNRVYAALGLKKEAITKLKKTETEAKRKNPSFPKSNATRTEAGPDLSELEEQIVAMMKV